MRDLADVLSEFARTMATDFPIQAILDHLVQRTVEILPITAAGVTLISPGTQPRYIAASNDDAMRFEQLQTDLGEGPCLAAYHSGEAVAVPDLSVDKRFPTFAPEALKVGLGAVFTFPLHHEDLRLGALDLYRDAPGQLNHASMGTAQILADVAAAYLLNARARESLEHSAHSSREASLHDALTGLPNRTLMLERLEHAFLRASRSHTTTALFFVDLDRFKDINDSYGHGVGDALLIAVGQRLVAVLRPGDTVARMSGDEFVILCEDLDEPTRTDTILQRIEEAFRAPFVLPGHELTVTASIGSAVNPHGQHPSADLLRDADLAMYKTKRTIAGADAHPHVDTSRFEQVRNGLAEALPGAIDRGELRLEYQPIVDTLDGHLLGAEALLRWTHPTHGEISPLQLIPLAERSGQIVELGQWILRQAWADRQRWEGRPGDDLSVSVNVSAHQLLSADFADMVATVLLAGSSDPKWLTFEVTESVFVEDNARAIVVLNALKGIGVSVALDDFGSGYSSLNHILSYPVDTIKVDRTFVAKLGPGKAGSATVTALINLGHNLGMTVVSEGVETADQHEELTRLSSDACQGFYFARPMPASDLELLIRERASGGGPRLLEVNSN